jgi:hypothetical protein
MRSFQLCKRIQNSKSKLQEEDVISKLKALFLRAKKTCLRNDLRFQLELIPTTSYNYYGCIAFCYTLALFQFVNPLYNR